MEWIQLVFGGTMKVGDLVEHKYVRKIGVIRQHHKGMPESYSVFWFDWKREAIEWHNVIRAVKSKTDKKCP